MSKDSANPDVNGDLLKFMACQFRGPFSTQGVAGHAGSTKFLDESYRRARVHLI